MICYFPYLCFNRDILKRVSFNLIRTSRHIPAEGVSSPCSLATGYSFKWCRFEVPGLLTPLVSDSASSDYGRLGFKWCVRIKHAAKPLS